MEKAFLLDTGLKVTTGLILESGLINAQSKNVLKLLRHPEIYRNMYALTQVGNFVI